MSEIFADESSDVQMKISTLSLFKDSTEFEYDAATSVEPEDTAENYGTRPEAMKDEHSSITSLLIEDGVDMSERPISQCCKLCWEILRYINYWTEVLPDLTVMGRHRTGIDIRHHKNDADLKRSAANGCGLCFQFVQGLQKARRQPYGPKISFPPGTVFCRLERGSSEQTASWVLKLRPTAKCLFSSDVTISYALAPAMNYGSVRTGHENTRDALPLCRAWLHNCVKSHRRCNHHQESWKPTRLLKIDGDVRVALASELEGHPSYATLSHCWGRLKFTTLTRNNLEQFRVRVPFEALTKSFQDAIYITRYLGLQYLWIDSLCILQDDPSDWRKESSLMSSVYGGSTVNIAATSASDGTMGCFFDRHLSWRSQIQDTEGRNTLWDCYAEHEKVLGESPLRPRGWVVQESFLSLRILHFTHREVFWECDEKIASESFPERFPVQQGNYFASCVKLFREKRPMTYAIWARLVEKYSSCKLTFVRDRLVAISGLARIFEAGLGDEYIFGLWRKNLESQLLWTAWKPSQRITPPLAPSWSWASLDGPCSIKGPDEFHTIGNVQQVEIIENFFADAPEECYTGLRGSSARLRLSCKHLFEITVSAHRSRTYAIQVGSCGRNTYACGIFDCRSARDAAEMAQIKLFFLPVVSGGDEKYTPRRVKGLMIKETGEARGQFRRVGVLCSQAKELRLLQEELMNSAYPIDDSKCVQVIVDGNGQRRFIIDLV